MLPHAMEVDDDASVHLMVSGSSEPLHGQTYAGHSSDAPKAKGKGKNKAQGPYIM